MKGKNTIVNRIAKYLRHEITYNNFKPEMHLKEAEIAKKFKISRVPVREAFRLIQSEGYIEVKPNKGSFVTKLDRDHLLEMGDVYHLLAPVVLEQAIPRYTHKTYKKANEILDKIEGSTDFSEIGYLIWDFAKIIYQPSKMKFLIHIFDEIYKHSIRLLNEFFDNPETAKFKVTSHREFIELCKNNKSKEAIVLWTNYLEKLQELMLSKHNEKKH